MHTAMLERMADKYADGDYEGFVDKTQHQVQWAAWEQLKMLRTRPYFSPPMRRDISRYELIVDGGFTRGTW